MIETADVKTFRVESRGISRESWNFFEESLRYDAVNFIKEQLNSKKPSIMLERNVFYIEAKTFPTAIKEAKRRLNEKGITHAKMIIEFAYRIGKPKTEYYGFSFKDINERDK